MTVDDGDTLGYSAEPQLCYQPTTTTLVSLACIAAGFRSGFSCCSVAEQEAQVDEFPFVGRWNSRVRHKNISGLQCDSKAVQIGTTSGASARPPERRMPYRFQNGFTQPNSDSQAYCGILQVRLLHSKRLGPNQVNLWLAATLYPVPTRVVFSLHSKSSLPLRHTRSCRNKYALHSRPTAWILIPLDKPPPRYKCICERSICLFLLTAEYDAIP